MGLVKTKEDGVLGWIQTFSLLAFFLGIGACAIGLWIIGLVTCFISVILYFLLYAQMQFLDERDRARKNKPSK